jgi:hypothetical protein
MIEYLDLYTALDHGPFEMRRPLDDTSLNNVTLMMIYT